MGRLTHRTAPGCTYFVTTKTWGNRALFQVKAVADIVAQRIALCRDRGAYRLHDFVIMPNHLHLLLTPGDKASIEKCVQLIKGGASYEIHRVRNHKVQIWQPGFHEATIRDKADFLARSDCIRMNPVTARLVYRPEDWHHSSASCWFALDPMPDKLRVASGAEAPAQFGRSVVGAKAPTP